MISRHAGLTTLAALTAVVAVAVSASATFAVEAGGVHDTYVSYSTYGTVEGAQIEISFDAAALTMQGWSLGQDSFVFPVSVGMNNAINLMTLNGDFLSMNGSPQVVGTIGMFGSEGQKVNIVNFTLPMSGRSSVPFMDGNHPVFEISGESLTVDINGAALEMRGSIRLHAAASELGMNAEIGEVGEFTLTSGIDMTDVDNTVRPVVADKPGSGPQELPGSDVTVGSLPAIVNWTSAGAVGGIRAYSVATTSCNIGTQPLDWFQGPSPRHPVIGQNMYRLKGGRFEQIGQSWLKHGFCALQQNVCQSCTPVCGGCCSQLGVGCSDPYSASRNGQFSHMGPKREINPHLGTNLGNHALASGNGTLRGRIQVHHDDLDPALNPGALYYVEGHYVAEDDAQFGTMSNDNNNASYRRVSVVLPNYNLAFAGATIRQDAAIHAWRVSDPLAEITNVDIPADGRLLLGYRVTDNGDGTWHYEYAVHNLTSERGARSFSVPLPPGVVVSNFGFHDVDYHSGDPYMPTDWIATEGGGSLTWSTDTFAQDQNANALRWGTLYNFRFDANSEPEAGDVGFGLFKPGSTPPNVTGRAFVPSAAGPAIIHGAAGTSFAEHAFGGYIDPRVESTDGVNVDRGIDSVTLMFSEPVFAVGGGAVTPASFIVTETGGGGAPNVMAVDASSNPSIVLTLNAPITIQEWTTIRANVENASGVSISNLGSLGPIDEPDRIDIGYLPTDADQSGSVTPFDLLAFRQIVNDVTTPDAGIGLDYTDTDRSGDSTPFDLLAFRQLINGVSPPATQAWNGASMNNARP